MKKILLTITLLFLGNSLFALTPDQTALFNAVTEANLAKVQDLLKRVGKPNFSEGNSGFTPLHAVFEYGFAAGENIKNNPKIVEALLKAGADKNIKTENKTVLEHANALLADAKGGAPKTIIDAIESTIKILKK